PASVWTRTTGASWLPSAIEASIAAGGRRRIASTSVMTIGMHDAVGGSPVRLVERLTVRPTGGQLTGAAVEDPCPARNQPPADPAVDDSRVVPDALQVDPPATAGAGHGSTP